jgi:hypothetical protein
MSWRWGLEVFVSPCGVPVHDVSGKRAATIDGLREMYNLAWGARSLFHCVAVVDAVLNQPNVGNHWDFASIGVGHGPAFPYHFPQDQPTRCWTLIQSK